MSAMDIGLSLEDIIKKKKKNGPVRLANARAAKPRATPVPRKSIPAPNFDARNKIIQKNRLKIRDARDALAAKARTSDVRLKLMSKRKQPHLQATGAPTNLHTKKNAPPPQRKKPPPPISRPMYDLPVRREVVNQGFVGAPRGYVDYDMMNIEDDFPTVPIRRTVQNDIASSMHPSSIPPFPSFGYSSHSRSSYPRGIDPFDCYEVPMRRSGADSDHEPPMRIPQSMRSISPDMVPRKGILRAPKIHSMSSRHFAPDENSVLSYEMRTRLERAPDPHASMGIFSWRKSVSPPPPPPPSSAYSQKNSSSSISSTNGYRIVVSNLDNSVTQSDIKELFEDIGELMIARLVRPGVGEVIFRTLKDAEKAVDTYHNRQLDGLPMKCLLVNPRAALSKPTAPALHSSGSVHDRWSHY